MKSIFLKELWNDVDDIDMLFTRYRIYKSAILNMALRYFDRQEQGKDVDKKEREYFICFKHLQNRYYFCQFLYSINIRLLLLHIITTSA